MDNRITVKVDPIILYMALENALTKTVLEPSIFYDSIIDNLYSIPIQVLNEIYRMVDDKLNHGDVSKLDIGIWSALLEEIGKLGDKYDK